MASSGSGPRIFEETVPAALRDMLQANPIGGHKTIYLGDTAFLVAFHRSTTNGFTALTQVPASLVNAPLYRAMTHIGIAGAVLALLGLVAGITTARRVGRPFAALAASSRQDKG